MKKVFFTLFCILFLYHLHAQVLYGTASDGGVGVNGKGVICKLAPGTNTLTSAFTFDDPDPDGRTPQYSTLEQASDGKLYGMTAFGGSSNDGTIFSYNPTTSSYTKLLDFNGINGSNPGGSLIQASDGKLYGMTTAGGSRDSGVIFSFDPATSAYTKLKDFDSISGYYPYGSLMQASDGKLYGMTTSGGSRGFGVIFSFNLSAAAYTKLKEFDSTSGATPGNSLMQAADGKLYGMTTFGGNKNAGVLFSFNPATSTYTKLKDFNSSDGSRPYGSLTQATDGKLYGMTSFGGKNTEGVIFSYNPTASTYVKLKEFDGVNGSTPYGNFVQASDGKLYGMTNNGGIYDDGVIFSFNPAASAYAKLKEFNGDNGANPHGDFTKTSDGKLYGLTHAGGGANYGVIFSFSTSSAAYTKLKVLGTVVSGSNTVGGVVKNAAGKLFGMFSNGGGTYGLGGIFSFNPVTSVYAKLMDFNGVNGANPGGSLTLAADGKLYGMTYSGGSGGYGVIFSFNPTNSIYTKLKDFDSINGRNPQANLIQAADGKLYGMTTFGGRYDAGVIFSYNPVTSAYTKLFDFDDTNGATPYSSLMQTPDGKLYGMTTFGGIIGAGVIFSYNPVTSTFTKLKDLTGTTGAYPYGSLIRATDGKLYSMTYSGGSSGVGVIFSFDPANSTYTKLKDFDNATGRSPRGSLMQAADGKLYGMTNFGGSSGYGSTFSYVPATSAYTKLQDFIGTNGKYPVYTFFTETTPTIKINDVSQPEGNSSTKNMTFTVTLSQTSTQTITVNYKTSNGTAIASSDYTAKTGMLTFAPGVKKKTISILIKGDTQVENDETLKVVLSNAVNTTIGDSTGLGTILNDDAAALTVTVKQSYSSTRSITVSPNPATSIMNVQLYGYAGKLTLQLTDTYGNVVQESKMQKDNTNYAQQRFNVSGVASGIYFIVVLDEKGNKQAEKVIVLH